ncbi:MAG: lipopolysaccharide biosynthesis protein [Syntrophothermus sp.]|nr:lipopolysaccharide biosynthesis protein [Syntrophothermus sp.]
MSTLGRGESVNETRELGFTEAVQEIDLRAYLKVLQKWKWLLVLITVLAMATSGVLSFFVLPPVYEAQVVLMATQSAEQEQRVVREEDGLESVVNTVSRLPQMTINSYVGQLKNEALLRQVIKTLKLDPMLYTPRTLAEMIEARAVKDTNLIEVKVSGSDPKLAARIANTLAKEFLEFISKKNQEQMARSVEFLQKQLAEEEKALAKATEALKKYEAEPRGVPLLEKEMTSKVENLTAYRAQLVQAEIEYEQARAAKEQIEEALKKTEPKITVRKFREDGQGTYEAEEINPTYVSLTQMLEEKNVALAEKEAQLKITGESISLLEEEIRDLQAELTDKRAQLERLQGDVERIKKTRDILAEKITQTKIAKSINLGETNLIVVSEAQVPDLPVKPRKMLNITVAGLLGIMVAVAAAFLFEYLDNTIKTPEDVKQYLDLPLLGSIPAMHAGRMKARPGESRP